MAKNRNRGRDKYQSPGPFGNKPKEKVESGSLPVVSAKEEAKEEKQKMSVEDVAKSESQVEFETNKARLIQELEGEVHKIWSETETAKSACEKAENDQKEAEKKLRETNDELDRKQAELATLSGDLKKAEEESEKAKGEADKILEKANAEAAGIVSTATVEATKKRTAAQQDAQKAFEEVSKDIEARGNALEDAQKKLEAERRKLKGEQELFELQKIDLDASKENIAKQKEIYAKANPVQLESMERKLQGKQEEYDQLVVEYRELREKHIAIQTKLDSIRAEVEDPENGKTEYALRDLLEEIRELKNDLAQKSARLEKYPTGEKILELGARAESATRREEELVKVQHQRDEYKQRYEAAQNLNGELSATKRELDATRALNEHLLQELEKNKTALENRTGNVCPALTNVDEEANSEEFKADIAKKKKKVPVKDLKQLVELIYNYAGNGNAEEQLYYDKDDLRSFLAGMAVSRLLILKGMSGTGKSSMPRIVSKAISGNHSLIPVESSWRDRNELLGYYNDFNKLFNAKKFTIELYRSGKAEEVPTFIVLDEMNLARIEYYFSDFLAILEEPEKSKWLVELVSSDMRTLPYELSEAVEAELRKAENKDAYELWNRKKQLRIGNTKVASLSAEEENILRTQLAKLNALIGAKDLIDGRKMRIPQNVWFVGTANEDESTFEISDKVYDRAQVIILNKKGVRDSKGYDTEFVEQFISTEKLNALFDDAIKGYKDAKNVQKRLDDIDEILIEKFHVSFGNRIVTQATKFAAVFTAAGGDMKKALDFQINTKILRKIIHSDDDKAFAALQKVCGDYEITSESISRKIESLGR